MRRLGQEGMWRSCGCSDGEVSSYNAGDHSIPGSGRSPGEGNGNPLQYSCLENVMDGGAWWATVQVVAKSWTRLNDFTFLRYGMGEGQALEIEGLKGWKEAIQ